MDNDFDEDEVRRQFAEVSAAAARAADAMKHLGSAFIVFGMELGELLAAQRPMSPCAADEIAESTILRARRH